MASPSSSINVQASFNPVSSAGNISPIPLLASLGLSNITFLQEFFGTYTPANDTLPVFNLGNQSEAAKCNFMLILVTGNTNIEIGSWYIPANGIYNFATNNVGKLYVLSQTLNTNNPISSLTLDGQSPQPQNFDPMAQGVPVTYRVIVGSAMLS